MKLLSTGALLTTLAFSMVALQVGAADSSGLHFAAIEDQPIITLTREHGMVRDVADGPLVSIYADGRVTIDRPVYMVQPGIFEQRLDAAALNALIQELDQADVLTLNTKELAAEHARAANARASSTGVRMITSDATTTRIDVRFASFARAGESPRELVNTLSYSELQAQASQYPSLTSLSALAATEARLMSLFDRPMRAAAGEQNNAK